METIIQWILLGVLALTPAAVLAQQAAQPKTEAAKGQTEKPQAKKEETKKDYHRTERRYGAFQRSSSLGY